MHVTTEIALFCILPVASFRVFTRELARHKPDQNKWTGCSCDGIPACGSHGAVMSQEYSSYESETDSTEASGRIHSYKRRVASTQW